MLAPPHRQQALGDEGAVDALERHHVCDGAERDEIKVTQKIGRRPLGSPEAALAQLAIERNQRHEHEADRSEMTKLRKIVLPVRIDHRERRRQRLVGKVMVDDDGLHAEPRGLGERVMAGGAAIDRDEQRRATLGERTHGFDVGPIALEQAVGNVDERREPTVAQEARQRRRRGRAVDIIVAEDRDLFAALDRVRDARRRSRHAGKRIGIWHQRPHGWVKEGKRVLDLHATAGKHARQ